MDSFGPWPPAFPSRAEMLAAKRQVTESDANEHKRLVTTHDRRGLFLDRERSLSGWFVEWALRSERRARELYMQGERETALAIHQRAVADIAAEQEWRRQGRRPSFGAGRR